jgi:hypothetical protein
VGFIGFAGQTLLGIGKKVASPAAYNFVVGAAVKGVRAGATAARHLSGYADVAYALGRPMFSTTPGRLIPRENALAYAVTTAGVFGAGYVGFQGGARNASIGLVSVAETPGMITNVPSPTLKNLSLRPKFIDNLGADGQLTLALHQLRGG